MNTKKEQIPIGMSLANCRGGVDAREVYDFIARHTGCPAYALRPRGGMGAAALDYYLILGAVGSAASIAGILWMAYDKFIAPKKRDARDSAGIYIAVRRPDGTVVEVWLGRDVHTREAFNREFELIIEEARAPELRGAHDQTLGEIQASDSWVKLGSKSTEDG